MNICLRVLKESNKSRFHSYSVRNSVLLISHITFRYCRVHIFPTTFLEIAVNSGDFGGHLVLHIEDRERNISNKDRHIIGLEISKVIYHLF